MRHAVLATILALLAWSHAARAQGEPFTAPVAGVGGVVVAQQAVLCRPAGSQAARLVVIAHGSPPDAAGRPRMQLGWCGSEASQWFVQRGYAVAYFLRPGYGATGGVWTEGYRTCDVDGYAGAGRETAHAIAAAIDAATRLPGIRPDGVVVVGQSAGGWGAVAYDSLPHPKVAAFISMAGGRGGHEHDLPNSNCHPENLAAAAGRFGTTATTPMLWVYAANDSFFAPAIAVAMHDAFTAAGGKAALEQPGPYRRDGHRLFSGQGGSAVWGPMVERYLAQMSASPR
ncbi:MAG: hypothetical protein WDN49_02560 [Acetobacteraceae bacterium]